MKTCTIAKPPTYSQKTSHRAAPRTGAAAKTGAERATRAYRKQSPRRRDRATGT